MKLSEIFKTYKNENRSSISTDLVMSTPIEDLPRDSKGRFKRPDGSFANYDHVSRNDSKGVQTIVKEFHRDGKIYFTVAGLDRFQREDAKELDVFKVHEPSTVVDYYNDVLFEVDSDKSWDLLMLNPEIELAGFASRYTMIGEKLVATDIQHMFYFTKDGKLLDSRKCNRADFLHMLYVMGKIDELKKSFMNLSMGNDEVHIAYLFELLPSDGSYSLVNGEIDKKSHSYEIYIDPKFQSVWMDYADEDVLETLDPALLNSLIRLAKIQDTVEGWMNHADVIQTVAEMVRNAPSVTHVILTGDKTKEKTVGVSYPSDVFVPRSNGLNYHRGSASSTYFIEFKKNLKIKSLDVTIKL